jgi:hypothetical protein
MGLTLHTAVSRSVVGCPVFPPHHHNLCGLFSPADSLVSPWHPVLHLERLDMHRVPEGCPVLPTWLHRVYRLRGHPALQRHLRLLRVPGDGVEPLDG